MRIADYLNAFSIEDLRELAERRGARLPESALKSRQSLVKSLGAMLDRYESVYPALYGLNQAETAVLGRVLSDGKNARLSRLAEELNESPAALEPVLDGLRLSGLLFPEGNWEHIVIPNPTRFATNYLPGLTPAK